MALDSKITHVIFDLDGLLVDSETCYTRVNEELCAKYGKKFTIDVKRKQMGRKPDEALQLMIDELQLPLTLDELRVIAHKVEEVNLQMATELPGVRRLVEHLHACGIPMCIASGSDERGFKLKTRQIEDLISKMTHFVLAGSDPAVRHGKPAPDSFIIAAERFDRKPDSAYKVLVFEDAVNGVRAGLAAGMRVVWVPSMVEDVKEMEGNLKDVTVLSTLEEFNPEEFGLPGWKC